MINNSIIFIQADGCYINRLWTYIYRSRDQVFWAGRSWFQLYTDKGLRIYFFWFVLKFSTLRESLALHPHLNFNKYLV